MDPASQKEKQDITRQISINLRSNAQNILQSFRDSGKLKGSEHISLMADIATEIYLQALGDLAYIAKGRDSSFRETIKQNHKIAGRKALDNFNYKAKERDKATRRIISGVK